MLVPSSISYTTILTWYCMKFDPKALITVQASHSTEGSVSMGIHTPGYQFALGVGMQIEMTSHDTIIYNYWPCIESHCKVIRGLG